MKTKTFLLLCLFSGIVLTQLSAQIQYPDPYAHNKHGTGATITTGGTELVDWGVPVFCDGEFVELLLVDCNVHYLDHWKNGEWISLVISVHGEAKSEATEEVFNFNEQFKNYGMTSPPWIMSWKLNLKGNQGSHYIVSFSYDITNDIFTIDKGLCF